jgi:polar amino acid transport system substrate-binding protein
MIRATPSTGKIACLVFLVAVLATACTSSAEAWQRIQSAGILRVGLDPTYPPFESADGGELRGIDVDLARAIGRELDLDVEFTYFGYDGLYDALVTQQVDVLISALVIRSDQTRDFAYSEPYFNAGQFLAVSPRNSDIGAMDDLSGRTLAVELGAQGHVIATEWQRQLPDLTVEPYQTPDEALEAVAQGRAHAVLVDAISARLFLATNDALRLLDPPVTVEPFAMVVRKEDERLLQELDTVLETLEDNGQLQSIINRHMLAPPSP